MIITAIIMKKMKKSYFFSFVTAVFYGTLLDIAISVISGIPDDTFVVRVVWYILGCVMCSFAVSLFFQTYISPEAYELIVKELAEKTKIDINKIKTAYDLISCVIGVVLSFSFFGFWLSWVSCALRAAAGI